MIHKVEFRNFKALRDVSLELERFTVLVGPNASGKTSVLEGLNYLALASVARRPEDVFREMPSPRLVVSAGAEGEMSVTGVSEAGSICLSRNPDLAASLRCRGDSEQGFCGSGAHIDLKDGAGAVALEIARRGDFVSGKPWLTAVLLRLDIRRLVAPSYSEEAVPEMGPDGDGLASVLDYLASNRPEDYRDILQSLQSVVPFVRGMRFPRASVTRPASEVITVDEKTFTRHTEREFWGNSIEFDMEGAPKIPASMVSEGTLLVLGLLTAIMGPSRPRLVLLDDIDRALHPKAQKDLVDLLRKLLDRYSDMQIVATSHSPYLLDHLKPEEVRLTALRDDGSVACGRLDNHPEFQKWKDSMTPGEFWSHVGENWLVVPVGEGRG